MVDDILKWVLSGIGLVCFAAAFMGKSRRASLMTAGLCAIGAGIAAHYHVFWVLGTLSLGAIWALVTAGTDGTFTTTLDAPLVIMKYQVSAADYARCAALGACTPAEPRLQGEGDIPATGVNFDDATAYAAWLSRRTGQNWMLPTDRQWAFAAGSRFADDALDLAEDDTNPAIRWLADYEREAARARRADPIPRPQGSFGSNENGLADIGGNVWEWTQTCHRRVHVDAAGAVLSELPACSIRVANGQHRTSMTFFIRDAKNGGCSVGVPPDNLGFRLVRQPAWYEPLLGWFRR